MRALDERGDEGLDGRKSRLATILLVRRRGWWSRREILVELGNCFTSNNLGSLEGEVRDHILRHRELDKIVQSRLVLFWGSRRPRHFLFYFRCWAWKV